MFKQLLTGLRVETALPRNPVVEIKSVTDVSQTHAQWQTFEKPENKRQMYGSQAGHLSLICGFSNVYHFASVWPTALGDGVQFFG